MTQLKFRSVVFDVDSTLVDLEGIDWLAEQRSPEVAAECSALTAQSMAGALPIDAVYSRRLNAIAPTLDELHQLGEEYCRAVQPGAMDLIRTLLDNQCDVHMVSGGLRVALLPLAAMLGVAPDHVHAVQLRADADHRFTMLDGAQPLATQQGKALVIDALQLARPAVMVGDGSTDAAARSAVDHFIAYTGVARRTAVVALADAEATAFGELHALLFH